VSPTGHNVFATNTEYKGSNGAHHYKITIANPINDTTTPYSNGANGGCTPSPGAVYSNNDGYVACVDDDAVTAEVTSQPRTFDYQHIYVVFEPRQVESCIFSDSEATSAGGNACTINGAPGAPSPTAAYCAYHSYYGSGATAVKYSIQPYPSCGGCSVSGWTAAQNQEHFVCHETREAVTDPQLNAWFDRSGAEADDKCAWSPTPFIGTGGFGYQYEWSNAVRGCVKTR